MSSEMDVTMEKENVNVEGTKDGLTNKERRLARKAEKQAARKSEGKESERKRKPEEEEEKEAADDEKVTETEEGKEEEEEEVDAISHKERRKRRKLEKQATKNESQSDPNEAKTVSDNSKKTKEAIQRSPFSLWVGNLRFQTSPARLQEWFETNGLMGITRVYMPKGAKKFEYNRGFAYVDVPSEEAMRKGVSLSEINLDGRRLLIKAGSDFQGRPSIDSAARALAEGTMTSDAADEHQSGEGILQSGKKGKTGLTKTAQKILRSQKHPPGPTLFIGNLSFNATEEGVRDMIERSAALRYEHDSAKLSTSSSKVKNARKPVKSDEKDEDDQSEDEGIESSSDIEDDKKEEGEENTQKADKIEKTGILRGAGIRKVRMGEFEDTGKCKGFAFIDFHSPSYATATLIDPRNGHLDGRELIVQYAGPEAIRRGAPKGKVGTDGPRRKSFESRQQRTRETIRNKPQIEDRTILAETAPEPGTFDVDQPLPKKHKETKEERMKRRENDKDDRKSSSRRMKPGAALAQAQRGKVAIDISAPQGQKKTFD